MLRVQVLAAARGGCRTELADVLGDAARGAARMLGGAASVIVLAEIDDDPFPAANPLCRPYDGVLEVQADAGVGLDPLLGALDGLAVDLSEVAHLDLSGVLVGAPQAIIPCAPTPLRYLYFMRRKAHTTRDAYLDHYFHHHAQFGFRTPNIAGYTQFHVDPDASAATAARLGVGAAGFDSVSELHLASLEEFFAGIAADERLGVEAVADEETFVDRENSVSICTTSTVVTP